MQQLKPALQFSEGRSTDWSGARLINCFAEKSEGDSRSDFAILPTPGLDLWAVAGSGPIRGSITLGGFLYVVSGNELYSVTEVGAATFLGGVAGTGPVRMAVNYTQLCIAAGGIGYVLSGGILYTPLAFDVSDVVYADGYIVWVVRNSEQFFISALDDALTYDYADIASVEGFPDNIVGVINDHRELQFYGEKSTEIFYNSGAADFPFERQGSAFIERGCLDRDSLAKIDNTVTFVGNDRVIYSLSGYQPQRISTHAIEYILRDTAYARAFVYTQEGHKNYCIETSNGTFLHDRATGAWHERKSWEQDAWRVGGAADAYGLTLLTDRNNGNIYTPNLDSFTENGEYIAMDIYLPTIEAGRERVTCYAFEMVCAGGVGNNAAADPQAMLQYSDDGGHRWSNEMWRSLGVVGEYRTRVIWRKLGQFRNRQFKLRITDSVRRLVISWFADFS